MAKTVVTGSHEAGYILYDDGTILLKNVRGAYVHAGLPYQGKADPKTGNKPEPKYGMKVMMDKTAQDKHKRLIEREINKLIQANGKGDLKSDAKCLKDGDGEGKDFLKGHWVLNTNERVNRPPALRGMANEKYDRETMGEPKIDALMKSGYFYDVLVQLWFQDNSYGRKVNCNLRAVKLLRKGDLLDEGGISDTDVDDAFGIAEGDAGFDADDEL